VAVSLALLIESFGRDVGWLWSHRLVEAGPATSSRRSAGRNRPTAFERRGRPIAAIR
jgi:hypothetical protein